MDHKPQEQIIQEIQNAKLKIKIGAKYQHYKGTDKLYEVLGFATLESNNDLCVIYKALYGKHLTFLRPVNEWLEQVEWQNRIIPRFKKI